MPVLSFKFIRFEKKVGIQNVSLESLCQANPLLNVVVITESVSHQDLEKLCSDVQGNIVELPNDLLKNQFEKITSKSKGVEESYIFLIVFLL